MCIRFIVGAIVLTLCTSNIRSVASEENGIEKTSTEANGAEGNGIEDYDAEQYGSIQYGGIEPKGTEGNGKEVNGAEVNGAEVNGKEVNGKEVNGKEVNGKEVKGAEVNGKEVNGAEVNGAEVNGNNYLLYPRKFAKVHYVPIEHYPFTVSFQEENVHICGGTLIKPLWVLTAAHCITGADHSTIKDASSFTVVGGLTAVQRVPTTKDASGPDSKHRRDVAQLIRHDDYQDESNDFYHDIALAKLSSAFGNDTKVVPVVLAPDGFVEPPHCETIGWGVLLDSAQQQSPDRPSSRATRQQPETTFSLTAVDAYVADLSFCHVEHTKVMYEDYQICVDTTQGGLCPKDTGGPLMGAGSQVGIASYILTETCSGNKMAVYTRVARYRDWIEENTPAAADTFTATWRPLIYLLRGLLVYVLM